MKEYGCDVAIVGAGPAGLAAAASAVKNGARKVIVVERDEHSGGILQQCIHAGFGLKYFGREMTGPEYAEIFDNTAKESGIQFLMDTTALEIREKTLVCANKDGMIKINYGALVLAMGCRERTRASIMIPGSRPSGIYTAGCAQRLINIDGDKVGREVVILGSGDIGMIMARRLTMEGAHVKAVVEIMPFLAGLTRNKVQCLDDFDIPLMLSHTIIDVNGTDRLSSVTVAPVDEHRRPITDKAFEIPCDTLLLSVGLIPENELSRTGGVGLSSVTRGADVNQFKQTSVPYIFACGNVLHVNDLVDNVSRESEEAGRYAAMYAAGKLPSGKEIRCNAGDGVRYVCPQRINVNSDAPVTLYFRTVVPGVGTKMSALHAGAAIAERRSTATTPGVMEELTVSADMLSKLSGDITVTAEHKEVLA